MEKCENLSNKDSSISHQMKELSRSRTKLESEKEAYATEVAEMEAVIRGLRVDKDELVLAISEKSDKMKDLQKSLTGEWKQPLSNQLTEIFFSPVILQKFLGQILECYILSLAFWKSKYVSVLFI